MNSNRICGLIFIILFCLGNLAGQNLNSIPIDSLKYKNNLKIDDLFNTTYFVNKNWGNKFNSFISYYASLNITNTNNNLRTKSILEFRSECGYVNFIDSIWIKTNDNAYLTYIWVFNSTPKIKNSISVKFKTQLTDTWEYNYSPGINERVWKSGPLLPASLIMDYGVNWSFWKSSYINFSFASIKINSISRNSISSTEFKAFAKSGNAVFNSQYGFNLHSTIIKPILKNLDCESIVNLFVPPNNQKLLNFDMQNNVTYKPTRYSKIKFQNKIAYDILISNKIQLRYEIIFGFSL